MCVYLNFSLFFISLNLEFHQKNRMYDMRKGCVSGSEEKLK
jgi:hypothetical protein